MGIEVINSAGWWGLLGIPAVLLIHLIQQRSKRYAVSTLFLLRESAPQSAAAREISWIRSSPVLYLQLLSVLLLTLLLLDPRWVQRMQVIKIALVLDSSYSMSAFRAEVLEAVRSVSKEERARGTVEWLLLDSHSSTAARYRGSDEQALFAALEDAHPFVGNHDPTRAFYQAQALLDDEQGSVIFISDRERAAPPFVSLLAVGRPIENVGFTGVSVANTDRGAIARVTVKNFGSLASDRTWWSEQRGSRSAEQKISLQPNAILTLLVPLKDSSPLTLKLSPDQFRLDDDLAIILPAKRRLSVYIPPGDPASALGRALANALEEVTVISDERGADIGFETVDTLLPSRVRPAVLFARNSSPHQQRAALFPERHRFTRYLTWSGLRAQPGSLGVSSDDEVLLWQGRQPLIVLHGRADAEALIFNFELARSNALSVPSVVLLISRYLDEIRWRGAGPARDNVGLGSRLAPLLGRPEAGSLVVEYTDGTSVQEELAPSRFTTLQAPTRPAHFRLEVGGVPRLRATANFVDVEESDFRPATKLSNYSRSSTRITEARAGDSAFLPLWTLLLAFVLGLGWWFVGRGGARPLGGQAA